MRRAPDVTPYGIFDPFNGEVFDVSVMTLIHLGAAKNRLYPYDLAREKKVGNKFILLGRPSIPAVFVHSFDTFKEMKESKKLTFVNALN